ncbi:DNA helicase RecQ [Aureibacter tunicatorum]|uniref:DNA helicase RecQ n=1 Tax=Aureibacter tunicatorum TaxID=866807 RepID=A0AAE3XLH5_9BACT|nr:DNA helicase RecQ [Aureibacter tunicatorum]MDR6238169.1 ATP-dependent DNA helicase RecQ [Aureibacter tunicatorum]BDD03202.1 ATP-dependent DNA helicase RecQ [Aureibacter tunicatorum]
MAHSSLENIDQLSQKLKDIFGYGHFRGNQEAIIKNILDKKNTFVIMPTGAGKSLCYQLPAIMSEGTALVISPLIALMKNQVDQMNALGINAKVLNSTLSKSELNKVRQEVAKGDTKLLYVAPESLTKEENIDFLQKVNISLAAIDEAHCISEWGHDFRPEYRKIKSILGCLGDMPIVALTATATPKVQLDIQRNLHMEDADVFKSSFNRKNLFYEVRPKKNIKKQLLRFINEHKSEAGVIYCLSRKKVEEISEFLTVNGIKALPYHAGMESGVRMKNQDAFLNEDADVIVATIAFGMGIDKPDVRFVVHYDTPKSLEGYYQETGRAGRDGLSAYCLMFYSYNDILKLEKFNKDKPFTERENAKILLEEMAAYAESAVCRTNQLMHYFGEHFEGNCGFCDNCKNPKELIEAQEMISLALKAISLTNEKFGINHLVNILRGSENQYVLSYNHNELDIYGQGKDISLDLWKSVFRNCILLELAIKDIEHIGVIKLSDKGKAFLKQPHSIKIPKDHDYSCEVAEEEMDDTNTQPKAGHDTVLFDILKKLRKTVADQMELPPFVVFQDPSLEEMATIYPTTKEELLRINGVGNGKARKFGKYFLEAIKKYVEENNIETATDVLMKSTVNKSKTKIFIIQQVDKKVDLEELANSRSLSFSDLVSELEHICYSGTKLSLDYYLDEIIDEEAQDDIFDYFMNAESDKISLALEEYGDEFTEDELRLMRIKFLSEYAN